MISSRHGRLAAAVVIRVGELRDSGQEISLYGSCILIRVSNLTLL